MGKLDDKVAIITGGASGIGAETARLFVTEGARVVLADIQDDKGEALADTLGDETIYQRTDVTEEASLEAVVQRAVDHFGRLDIMFNNAGIPGPIGSILELDADAYDRAQSVLLRAILLGCKHAGRVMVPQRFGVIINTSSVAATEAGHAPHAYSALKAAVAHATRTISKELGESNVRVNAIKPGGVVTPILGKGVGFDQSDADATVKVWERILANAQPIRRAGQASDIARAALWLASEDASFVTGTSIEVDGGLPGGPTWVQQQKISEAFVSNVNAALRHAEEE